MIEFFDAKGKSLGSLPRSKHRRLSQSAAADHRKMDTFKQQNPACIRAVIHFGESFSQEFKFVDGQSRMAS